MTGSSLGLGATVSVASPGIAENSNGPSVLMGSAAGTVTTPATITFQWRDLTRSPVYVLELCAVPMGSSTCFSSQAGVTAFDSPSLILVLVDPSDPTLQPLIGQPVGLGPILPFTRTGFPVSLGPLPLGRFSSTSARSAPVSDSRH